MSYHSEVKRSRVSDAVILKVERSGEINKYVTLITREFGLVNAVAYGAYKGTGKLTGATDLLMFIRSYFYVEPTKQTWKITDAVIYEDFPVLKGKLKNYYYASFCSELILKSHGAGDAESGLLELMVDALRGLNVFRDDKPDYALIQFILKFIRLSGEFPDILQCRECGKDLDGNAGALFDFRSFGFLCPSCSAAEQVKDGFFLSVGVLKYLKFTERLSFNESLRVGSDDACRSLLLEFAIAMAQTVVGTGLNSARRIALS